MKMLRCFGLRARRSQSTSNALLTRALRVLAIARHPQVVTRERMAVNAMRAGLRSRAPMRAHPLGSARLAHPLAAPMSQVVAAQRMPMRAVGTTSVHRCASNRRPPHILHVRYRLNVKRIHAGPIAAQVVEFKPFVDTAEEVLVDHEMSGAPITTHPSARQQVGHIDAAVAVHDRTLPFPARLIAAARAVVGDDLVEPLIDRHVTHAANLT